MALLALLMVMTAVQLGPLAPPAAAAHTDVGCTEHYQTRENPPGSGLEERCEPVIDITLPNGDTITVWRWRPVAVKETQTNMRTNWVGGDTSPPYYMTLTALMSSGSGGGYAVAKDFIFNRDGTPLNRTIAARVVIQHWVSVGVGAWYTCNDSNWQQASVAQDRMRAVFNQYTQPDCGAGDYRALAAGRFWSVSLNKWITRGWVYSPAISLSLPNVVTEPTSTPTPTPATPD